MVIEDNYKYQLIPWIDLSSLEGCIIAYKNENRAPLPIDSITFNPERYSGMLIKFSTPYMTTGSFPTDKFIEMGKLIYHKLAKKSRGVCPADADYPKHRKIMRVVSMMQSYWFENSKSSKRFRPKVTTVKLLRSGRINLDQVNDHDQAVTTRAFIVDQIMNNWSEVVHYDDDE
ncbi:hypothetical protein PC116_g16140 [Phytophthora cactorum]|uniref:Uncharacterized protein n=2 Tax=Phytophthora cactorum TaxID=29920 RepID=A0A8T1BDS4_9STRA|nr:hypothetical protein PC111_g11093 [Phytophthora cactorum]KAG2901014.1 hypothetical protein PC114_g13351 [Phytophthora cactorum]KAG2901539.1 hypothetical protein PC117_g21703 [Phytophthora cactorum]KAG2914470.1 hypothetical protein PC115_g11696 [Phytophthora cactorum]KAG3020080.1 hypothetical protein PC120_g9482 [Phytophthora cactorum]